MSVYTERGTHTSGLYRVAQRLLWHTGVMSAHETLNWNQFRRHVIPGEYNGVWKNVPKHRDFKFGQPVSELAEDIAKKGIKNPVLVYKPEDQKRGVLIEGHHRAVAAGMVGAEIPVEYTSDSQWEPQAEAAREAHLYKRRMR